MINYEKLAAEITAKMREKSTKLGADLYDRASTLHGQSHGTGAVSDRLGKLTEEALSAPPDRLGDIVTELDDICTANGYSPGSGWSAQNGYPVCP